MNKNLIYNNLPVRIETTENEIWFSGVDVCEILEYQNPRQAIGKLLDEDEKKLEYLLDTSGQKRKTWMINESGLYSLILTSTKPEAKTFKKWITHEVLPSLRKAGIYTTDQAKQKQLKLEDLRKSIDTKKSFVSGLKSQQKDLESEIKKSEQEFWAIFETNPNQLSLFDTDTLTALKQ